MLTVALEAECVAAVVGTRSMTKLSSSSSSGGGASGLAISTAFIWNAVLGCVVMATVGMVLVVITGLLGSFLLVSVAGLRSSGINLGMNTVVVSPVGLSGGPLSPPVLALELMILLALWCLRAGSVGI